MKKLSFIILSITSVVLLFSCHKKEKEPAQLELVNTEMTDGLPQNYKSINGYLYSGVQTYQYSSSSTYYYSFSYAAFCDPSKNLISSYNHYTNNKNFSNVPLGNIDVGNVTLNGVNVFKNLQQNFEVSYQNNSSNINFLNYNASWKTDGNRTFKPIEVSINKGHPVILTSGLNIPTSIPKNSNFSINIGTNISNYDSLIVILEDGNWNGKIRKVVPKNALSLTFTTQEMSILYTSNNGKITFYAYNYSNMTVDSKVTLFELSNQYILSSIYIY